MENVNLAAWSLGNIATLLVACAFGWKAEEVTNFGDNVEAEASDDLDRVLLSIPGIGEKTASRIVRACTQSGVINLDNLQQVDGIGPHRAQAIMAVLEDRAEPMYLLESNAGPRTATREKWERVVDSDLPAQSHPNCPAVWMRAHDHTAPSYTNTGDNPVVRDISEQFEIDNPNRLMQEQAPEKDFYSQAKALPAEVHLRLRQQERNFHSCIRFLKTNKEDKRMLTAGSIHFEKQVAKRVYRKRDIAVLRELFRRCIRRLS
jgi:NAD-dependent DNA ligase